jgi:hypothetical protein
MAWPTRSPGRAIELSGADIGAPKESKNAPAKATGATPVGRLGYVGGGRSTLNGIAIPVKGVEAGWGHQHSGNRVTLRSF